MCVRARRLAAVDISAQRELESSRLGAASTSCGDGPIPSVRAAHARTLSPARAPGFVWVHECGRAVGVLGSIELAISRPMGPELKAPLATASASAKHLMAVLESMLTLSALEVRKRARV